jgi:hypothetical protein
MKIESVYGNQVSIRNCGKGSITQDTLSAYLDDIPLNIFSTNNTGKEDFTIYTKACPNNHINITAYHLDFAGTHNENCYLYVDKGVNYFTDWTHLIDAKLISQSGDAFASFYALANDINDLGGVENNGNTSISLRFYNSAVYLHETYGGSSYETSHSVSVGTQYYVKIVKSGTSIWVGFYSDAARTNLLFNLSLTLHANHNFRYIYAANNWNNYLGPPAGQSNVSVDNLLLQGPSATVINEDDTGTISLSGLWNFNLGGHTLRIASPRVVAEAPVNAVLPDSTVLDLEFDEGQGSIAHDSSGNGNDGTLGNGTVGTQPTWKSGTACKYGNCLGFEGTPGVIADVVSTSDFMPNSSLTITAWIYPKKIDGGSSGDERAIASKWASGDSTSEWIFRLRNTTPSEFQFYIMNTTNNWVEVDSSGANIQINNWYYVAVSYDINSGQVTFYKNGVPLSGGGYIGTARNGSAIIRIGAQGGSGSSYDPFNGTIDSVRIYNDLLTPDQTISLRPVSYD